MLPLYIFESEPDRREGPLVGRAFFV